MKKRKTFKGAARDLIFNTAKILLRRHGQDNLAIVDIARALGMSHANVYRYFRNKTEILDAIIDEWMLLVEEFVESIANRPGTAAQRLEAVVIEVHRKRREKFLEDAAVFESYRRLAEARPDAIAKRREKILHVFERIFREGIANREFAAIDPNEAAVVLEDATALFLHPLMIPTAIKEDTGTRAQKVVRSILAGFAIDTSTSGAAKKSTPTRR